MCIRDSLISVQAMGGLYTLRTRRRAVPAVPEFGDNEIIELWEVCCVALNYIIAITDRDKPRKMAELYSRLGLQPILTNLAMGTARSEHLALYGLDSTEKAITGSIANDEDTAKLIKAAKEQLYIDIPGNGVMLAIPIKSVAGGRNLSYLSAGKAIGGRPKMEFKHELIIAILNEGQSDSVMKAAREAGATGGTVLHAKRCV